MIGKRALITLQATSWSGWDREGYSIVTSAQLWVEKGRTLNPETLGARKADYTKVSCLFYEVLVERIVEGKAGFAYRNLVIANPNGTVNLGGPTSGRFILQPGESMKLRSATMDMGTTVTVSLHEIR
jgi:hypothetical protein